MSFILKKLEAIDHSLSAKIHDMKYQWSMDYCLYIPGKTFNGIPGILVCTIIISVFFTGIEKDMGLMRKRRLE